MSQALVDLSARVGKRGGDKIVVKIMWDRGAFEQLVRYVGFFPIPSELRADLVSIWQQPRVRLGGDVGRARLAREECRPEPLARGHQLPQTLTRYARY